MEAALEQPEQLQTQILEQISKLEITHISQKDGFSTTATVPASTTQTISDIEGRLSNILRSNGIHEFSFKKVLAHYYDWPLESRRDILSATSVNHLCKSIVLYTARFNAETVKNFLYSLNNGKIPKMKFNLRLAPEKTSMNLTGYEHNAVTCVGMKTDIPVILDEAITELIPAFFWLGGGETDLKLRRRTSEFIKFIKPFIVTS